MNVITTFKEKQQEKQLKYERKLIREISLSTLRKNIFQYFCEYITEPMVIHHLEDYCIELAIESYLLGARYSKFGYYGEPVFEVKQRCLGEEQSLAEVLFHFLSNSPVTESWEECEERLYEACQRFISSWWNEGYERGERRYRLRLR
ncbi:DUF2521 family protein [Microbacteriaceae bacterium 4G12]